MVGIIFLDLENFWTENGHVSPKWVYTSAKRAKRNCIWLIIQNENSDRNLGRNLDKTIPTGEEHKRAFRLLDDILKKINKHEDREFITDIISQSRSLNIVIKKLYFEFAPIEKRNMESLS